MSLFKTLREKPWESPEAATPDGAVIQDTDPLEAARIGLWFVIAVVSVLFGLFIITFLSRSQYPDFQALAGQPWQPFTDATRLWANTGILAAASIAMQLGLSATRRGHTGYAVAGIGGGAFLSVVFLLAQFDLWLYLQSLGFYLNTNPANSYFYLLTAVHGIHIIGGLIALANVLFRAWYDQAPAMLAGPLRLCTRYWHFLLLVWLVLFFLLTSPPSTINALAAMCGF